MRLTESNLRQMVEEELWKFLGEKSRIDERDEFNYAVEVNGVDAVEEGDYLYDEFVADAGKAEDVAPGVKRFWFRGEKEAIEFIKTMENSVPRGSYDPIGFDYYNVRY